MLQPKSKSEQIDVAPLVRVSSETDRQDYERQVSDLTAVARQKGWNIVKVVSTKISASKTKLEDRPDIAELYELVESKAINKVMVTELTRLGRKARDIREVYDYLMERGVTIYVQSMGLDTGADEPLQKAINSIIVNILAELAEVEIVNLRQRVKSGMAEAKRKGKHVGRPFGSTVDMVQEVQKRPEYRRAAKALKEGLSLRKTAAYAGISVNTVRKIKEAVVG